MVNRSTIDTLISAWQTFLNKNNNWEELIKDVAPKQSGCGILYELHNPLKRPNEDFAIADMRQLSFAEPHYHPEDNYEIYFVLQGKASIVIGNKKRQVASGDVIIIPPLTAHYTIPDKHFVLAAVNTPPFKPENYIVVTDTNKELRFDRKMFGELCTKKN